jgi:hypothetical protein
VLGAGPVTPDTRAHGAARCRADGARHKRRNVEDDLPIDEEAGGPEHDDGLPLPALRARQSQVVVRVCGQKHSPPSSGDTNTAPAIVPEKAQHVDATEAKPLSQPAHIAPYAPSSYTAHEKLVNVHDPMPAAVQASAACVWS